MTSDEALSLERRDSFDDATRNGTSFNITTYITHANATPIKSVLDFSAVPADKIVRLHPLIMGSSGGRINIRTYKIDNYSSSGAVTIDFINQNYEKTTAPNTLFITGITTSDSPGDDLRKYFVGSGTNPVNRSGGSHSDTFAIIPDNSKICIETTNVSGSSADFGIAINITERAR